ncbi:MAG: hypothetical protein GY799_27375 [Desulfobulbaceae bacterium]|nr:hypothetical protein [Desulfobulbaceae bacterium]
MASTAEIIASILNMTGDEFFSTNQEKLAEREFQLIDLDYWGVAVNAPGQIEVDQHDTLPLFLATRYSGERGWSVQLENNCFLVSTNLQDGSVQLTKAFVDERELATRWHETPPAPGPTPSGLPLYSAVIRQIDARERTAMNWDSGLWSLGIINYDWSSNVVEVELLGEKPAQFELAKPVSPQPNFSDSGILPCYLPTPKSPQLPEEGLIFTGKFGRENDEQQFKVFGSFVVTVRDFHLPIQKVVQQYENGMQQNVAAVVPVTFVLLGLDWDEPLKFDWAVPVYGETLAVGMQARGYFAIDAFNSESGQELDPGEYVCYVILDSQIYGPKSLKVL